MKGFSLIEILVVAAIFAFITASLLSNALRSRVSVIEVAKIVVSDIRVAQANSLAAKQYNGEHRCGYGIHFDSTDKNKYSLFVGRQPNPSGCPNNWQYQNPDTIIYYTQVLDSRLEFFDPSNQRPNNYDIVFEPYNGKIRIDTKHEPLNDQSNLSQIGIKQKNKTCSPTSCLFVCVYSFGRISIRDTECPLCSNPATCSL